MTISSTGSKSNSCPSYEPSTGYICHPKCTHASACAGIQKCCHYSHCGLQCVDPVSSDSCVYRGHIYPLNTDFKPSACTECTCKKDKLGYGLAKYGGAQCSLLSCDRPRCKKTLYIPGQCCPVCLPTGQASGRDDDDTHSTTCNIKANLS